MKNKKLAIIVSLVTIVLAVGVFFVLHQLNSDSRKIEQAYSSIAWPSYLTLTNKQAQDDRKYDPQLDFLWEYTYVIKSDSSHERVKNDLRDSLLKQGYGNIVEYDAAPPDQYSFHAEGKGIHLIVTVGDKNEPRNKDTVLVIARVSD